MAALVIVDIRVTDPVKFAEYKKLVPGTIAAFDGKYLARGGRIEMLEGGWNPERIEVEPLKKSVPDCFRVARPTPWVEAMNAASLLHGPRSHPGIEAINAASLLHGPRSHPGIEAINAASLLHGPRSHPGIEAINAASLLHGPRSHPGIEFPNGLAPGIEQWRVRFPRGTCMCRRKF